LAVRVLKCPNKHRRSGAPTYENDPAQESCACGGARLLRLTHAILPPRQRVPVSVATEDVVANMQSQAFKEFTPHCPALSPRLAGFGFPLKDYAAKPGKTWLPPLTLP